MLRLSPRRRRMPATRLWFTLSAIILLAATGLSARAPYNVTIESNVTMKTADGGGLSADIYRPKAEGKFPVLLERTPYDKHRMTYAGVDFGVKAAARGFVYVIQDCRGRFASEGDWYVFKNESQDGYDAIGWGGGVARLKGKGGAGGVVVVRG